MIFVPFFGNSICLTDSSPSAEDWLASKAADRPPDADADSTVDSDADADDVSLSDAMPTPSPFEWRFRLLRPLNHDQMPTL